MTCLWVGRSLWKRVDGGGFRVEESVMENLNDGSWAAVLLPAGVVVLGLLVLYYVLLVQAVLQMLRSKANQVLLTFA